LSHPGVEEAGRKETDTIRLLFSAAWPGLFEIDALPGSGIEVSLVRRSVDWDVSRWRHLWLLARDCIGIARAGRRHDVTIVCTGGLETFLVPLLWPLFGGRKAQLVMLDPIALASRRLDRIWRTSMRQVSLVLCIREHDKATYGRRFGVPAEKCQFIAMPAPRFDASSTDTVDEPVAEEGYVYSAGLAHRDWPLLFRACAALPYRCIVSTPSADLANLDIPPNVEVHPALSPEDGRRLMRNAAVVAVTFEDTDLACGPTIVLDALAMGIPVVANDTNACRDYIVHGSTGLISGTGDHAGLAENITTLMESPQLRERMGAQGKRMAEGELSHEVFEEKISRIVKDLLGAERSADG
jgi:glycosyltransferase involved in cell wall biosynthesis